MRTLVAALLVAAALPAAAASVPLGNGYGAIDAPRDTDPVRLGEAFCAARIAGDMSRLEPWIAPKLTAVLAGAGEVPWQSYPDRPTDCVIEVVNGAVDTIGVLLRITYATPQRTWSDTLNLERTPTSWLINNVFYETGGNLLFRVFIGNG
jgi:hypothetical protein